MDEDQLASRSIDLIFEIINDGQLYRLKGFLERLPKDRIDDMLLSKRNGTPPLVTACRKGHFGIVKYLVQKHKVNIEEGGIVQFDTEIIDYAPPLWCVAAAGFDVIARFLLDSGANVNCKTNTNSTPLRAACYDGHLNIVKLLCDRGADIEIANRSGHNSLMISCYMGHTEVVMYLLERGANASISSLKGNTALHDCAESGSLPIMKQLLAYNAKMHPDSYGITPILASAHNGRDNIVDYLSGREDIISAESRIAATELLGCTYVDKKHDLHSGVEQWIKAMAFRLAHDPPVVKHISKVRNNAYGRNLEATTMEELEFIKGNPDLIRIQSLIIRERVLGYRYPDVSYYIRYRGAVYADSGNFSRCITLWRYALDMQRKALEPLNPMIQSSLVSFAELFHYLAGSAEEASSVPLCQEIMFIFANSVSEIVGGLQRILEHSHDNAEWEKIQHQMSHGLIVMLHLVDQLCSISGNTASGSSFTFKKLIHKLIRLNPTGNKGASLLHLACTHKTTYVGRYPVGSFPSVIVIKCLIDCGSVINATDAVGDTPLHYASRSQHYPSIRILLEGGAHLDRCNKKSESPLDILMTTTGDDDKPILHQALPDNTLNYCNLQCLSARVIRTSHVPVPTSVSKWLAKFIAYH